MKIAVVGAGYVGLSNAIFLAKTQDVYLYDVSEERIALINERKSTIDDLEIIKSLKQDKISLIATTDEKIAYTDAEYILIAISIDYDARKSCFETTAVEEIIETIINLNSNAVIVFKSTVPIGYTSAIQKKYRNRCKFLVSPEFLREGNALQDVSCPNRIIVGMPEKDCEEKAVKFGKLLQKAVINSKVPVLYLNSTEAEAVKLFSNAYLAMRVAFFNELDSFAECKELDTRAIIEGMGWDSRIGAEYNNPSFGYGGYCLPKDTKQLLSHFKDVPSTIIESIVLANQIRKEFIAKRIMQHKPNVVGIYRLAMKKKSDNYRESSLLDIICCIKEARVIIYEPLITTQKYNDFDIINNLEEFKNKSEIIVANRLDKDISDVTEKVYTRDLFNNN